MENWVKTLWKILEIKYNAIELPQVRSYLLPDGKFLRFQDEKNSRPHYDIANFLGNFVFDYLHKSYDSWRWDSEEDKRQKEKEFNVTEKDIQELYDGVNDYETADGKKGWNAVESDYGFPLIEDLGAIRLNGSNENYIVLSETNKPTSAQYMSLTFWFDDFFNHDKTIELNAGYEFNSYNSEEYTTDDMINRIKRYYSSGKLYESINSISYEKIDTQEDAQKFLKHAKETFKDDASNFTINQAYNGMKKIMINGNLVGYIGFSEYKGEEGDNFNNALGIGNFMILDKGKGYGTAVIKDIIDKYKNKYDLIYCFVDADNTGAINLYKKLGKVYDEEGPNDNGQYYVTFYDKTKELNEVYPNKGESKEDFISRFMSVTKDEYPDQKQRLAVAYSYWDRRNNKNLKESIIDEATRNTLIAKSKKADSYSDKSKGNRWTRKDVCTVANTVKDYNQIDMDTFWKQDKLNFNVKVQGETDQYSVNVEFSKILPKIERRVKDNENKLDINAIYESLLQALNSEDVKISCDCPDYKYRIAYFNSENGYNSGRAETRKSDITNPDDTKGAGCKHVLSVLNNIEWLRKIASVINNYINYCKDKMQYNYARFIFPKIYGMNYDKAVQMTLDDYDENGKEKDNLQSDEALINLSNALGKVRGRIKPGSNKNPVSNKK